MGPILKTTKNLFSCENTVKCQYIEKTFEPAMTEEYHYFRTVFYHVENSKLYIIYIKFSLRLFDSETRQNMHTRKVRVLN
jgi:hypothetical protein